MQDYTCNVIEKYQDDGSMKVVLGAIIDTKNLSGLSASITLVDQIILMALQEEYSTPAVVEFFGKYMLGLAQHARRSRPSETQLRAIEMSEKMAYALLGAAKSLEALAEGDAAREEDVPVGGLKTIAKKSSPPSSDASAFIRNAKKMQKDLDELDGQKKT